MSENNWMETAAKWLTKPIGAFFGPWWEKNIEAKAADIAVRRKVLEAIVYFRMRDFAKLCSVDQDRAAGIASKIVDLFKSRIDKEKELDLTTEAFLQTIENEIHIQAVPITPWVQLACLCEIGNFNPKKFIAVEFTDDQGGVSHCATAITSLGSSFPFSILLMVTSSENARLSPAAIDAVRDYCSRRTLPETKYDLLDSIPPYGWSPQANVHTLARAWKPSA